MIALTTAVAIAVTCSVIFMVSAVVTTIIWVKIRQERKSLAFMRTQPGPYAHGLSSFPAETFTELSREEGSALRQYGQLPYGRPTEWGLLASRESLAQPAVEKPTIRLLKKTRSFNLKHSLSSKSFLPPKSQPKPGSLTTLTEASEIPSQDLSVSKENLIVSAVDGALELPTETTPRQTPEREEAPPGTDNKAVSTIRPVSSSWPFLQPSERTNVLFPVFEDRYEGSGTHEPRARGGSIASQTPGMAPDQPVPPPPCAYPPNRFRLSKTDSLRYSSVSIETADSSILDDSRRTSTNIDSALVSPALPPCPTFAPFSANDVEKGYHRNSPVNSSTPFIFPPNSPARKGQRVDSSRTPPRRSLTACSPTRSAERVSPPPRRSESLSAKQSSNNTSQPYLDLDHIPPLRVASRNSGLLPHFSQMQQRHSMHTSPRRDNDPFYNETDKSYSLTYNPGRRPNSFLSQTSTVQTPNGHPKPPLASAMKSSGHRKGHRRQNCVRISIHPPMTFASRRFSPMAEEPEEPEEIDVDIRQSEISDVSTLNASRDSSVSAISVTNRNSMHEAQTDRPISRIVELPNDARVDSSGSPIKKKRQTQTNSSSTTALEKEKEKVLPELVTSLPATTDKDSLSQTPSPERTPITWKVPYQSPVSIENSPASSSPRRSVIMGPRSQPKPARNSYQPLIPSEDTTPKPAPSAPATRPPRSKSTKESESPATSSSSSYLRRAKSEANDQTQTPPRSKSQDERSQKRASNYITSTSTNTQQSKTPGTQVSAIVPIWEDCNKDSKQATPRRSTVSLVYDPPKFPDSGNGDKGETSPSRVQGDRDRMMRMTNYGHSKTGFMTPARRTVGLGVGINTPGSLYDGEGFLKE
ncbi:hypothetical protein BDV18DRAFT_140246 [Aspergillus unguis]